MDAALLAGGTARAVWLGHLERIALPVLAHAATGDLGRVMTVEHRPG
jgi:hypothetical protein